MTKLRCDVGGIYDYCDEKYVYQPPCPAEPVFRYRSTNRSDGWVEGHWSHRCAEHIKWLSEDIEFQVVPYKTTADTPEE